MFMPNFYSWFSVADFVAGQLGTSKGTLFTMCNGHKVHATNNTPDVTQQVSLYICDRL